MCRYPQDMNLAGKTIVITGAAQGIGRALAQAFADAQANLALIDMNAAALEETRAACEQGATRARRYVANVADENAVATTFADIERDFGRLDGLVNNAGITRDALLIKVKDGVVTGRMSLAQWQAVIDVNLTGTFLCGREAAQAMIKFGNGGVIVNISSIARHGNVGQTNYCAAKAGVAVMTNVWARELARYNIRVGAIAPGFTRTAMAEQMKPEALEKAVAPIPLRRMAETSEIAHAVKFIFENDYFTARCIDVDAGLTL